MSHWSLPWSVFVYDFLPILQSILLRPRGVLITGATSGIGRGLAEHYAKHGCILVLTGRRQPLLDEVAASCKALGSKQVITCCVDVTNRQDMYDVIETNITSHSIDLVIANAGVSAGTLNMPQIDATQTICDINCIGVANTVAPSIKVFQSLPDAKRRQIAIVCSILSLCPFSGSVPYSASKAFTLFYGEGLRSEYYHQNISINSIVAGYVDTNMSKMAKQRMLTLSTEEASKLITEELSNDTPVIYFPARLYLLLSTLRCIPYSMRHAIAAWIPVLDPALGYLTNHANVSSQKTK